MKKKCVILTYVLLLLSVCGCAPAQKPKDNNKTVSNTKAPYMAEEKKELSIYTIDYNTYECIPSISMIPKESKVDAELIVNEVVANFKENVTVLDIKEQDDSVVVSFSSDDAPVKNVSRQMEISMLDSIAYSLLDNLSYCKEVYFRCGSKNYVSSNIELAYDEPYVSK